MSTPFLSQLHKTLGPAVSTDQEELARLQEDKSGQRSVAPPLAVVTPSSVDQVQQLMRLATEYKVPVVPRGGGSGLAGGAIGSGGEVVLSTQRLDSIVEISVEDRLAKVQAGVINHTLNERAKDFGLWFTPDPASRQWSTVGGNIATNAGGLLCAKYGVTRESVLELTVVLADGRVVHMGHRSVKGVTGLDLCNLMIGSEGTLGIIVEATVKLVPLSPHPTWTLRADFTELSQATSACQHVLRQGLTPAVLELMDDVAFERIAAYIGEEVPDVIPSVVIAQTDGPDAEHTASTIAVTFEEFGAVVEVFGEGAEAERLLTARRSMHPAMEATGNVLIEDIAVPRSRLREMFEMIRDIEDQFNIAIPTVAHAADGNLHPNLIYTGSEVPEEVWRAADKIFRGAIELGGTLTGEHGVGLLKKQWLREELGDDQWQLQRDIKKVFDPHNLLNPGKVFSD